MIILDYYIVDKYTLPCLKYRKKMSFATKTISQAT